MKDKEIKIVEANKPKLTDFEFEHFCLYLAQRVHDFYKNPANLEAYNKWKVEKEKRRVYGR